MTEIDVSAKSHLQLNKADPMAQNDSSGEQHKTDIVNSLTKQIVDSTSISQLWSLIKDLKPDKLQEISCDVVQCTCKFLNDVETCRESVSIGEQIFLHMANTQEPKEVLILLIEHAREHWTDDKFQAVLLPVLKTLRRIKSPVGHSLAFALDAFTDFLVSLPLPTVDPSMQQNERLLLDADPCVLRIIDTVPRFISFVRPFVKRVSWSTVAKSAVNTDTCKQISDLRRSILKVTGRPLGHLDLVLSPDRARSTVRTNAERCVHLIGQLESDFVRLIVREFSPPGSSDSKENSNKQIGLCTFAFLAFGENLIPDHIPSVYSRRFLLELNAPLIANLLEEEELLPKLHGAVLCIRLLENVEQNSLPAELVESEDMRRLVLAVVKAAAGAKTKELCSFSLKVLTLICGTLESIGKLHYLYAMLKIAPRTGGVVGCIIGMVTNEIVTNIDNGDHSVFAGSELERLLNLVFALPNGEKTDLMDNSERIMAAMKLLKVVLPRDRKQNNVTGIWNLMATIENKYFRLLFSGLELSRSHYQLEIRKLKELRRGESTGKEFISHGASVELSKHQQIGVMETAVHTFSMMEDVAKQVVELIHSMQTA